MIPATLLTLAATPPPAHTYRPFLDPLPITGSTWWLLIIPLALGVSVIYKAIKVQDMTRYARNVAAMFIQILGAILLATIGIHLLIQIIIPTLDNLMH